MNQSGHDDQSDFDDLIRELRELKRFIDEIDPGESDATEITTRDYRVESTDIQMPDIADEAIAASDPATAEDDFDEPTEATPPPIPSDDDLPLLNQVVHRPGSEAQMDLLSMSVSTPAASSSAATPSDMDADDEVDTEELLDTYLGDAMSRQSSGDSRDKLPGAGTANVRDQADSADFAPPDDDDVDNEPVSAAMSEEELDLFVLDLSDRIVDIVDDRLTEHNGEILPRNLREDIKHRVADILYEWCEN